MCSAIVLSLRLGGLYGSRWLCQRSIEGSVVPYQISQVFILYEYLRDMRAEPRLEFSGVVQVRNDLWTQEVNFTYNRAARVVQEVICKYVCDDIIILLFRSVKQTLYT